LRNISLAFIARQYIIFLPFYVFFVLRFIFVSKNILNFKCFYKRFEKCRRVIGSS